MSPKYCNGKIWRGVYYCEFVCYNSNIKHKNYAPMAQPDSASDSDSDGWRFKSAWVYHSKTAIKYSGFIVFTGRT